MFTAEFHCNLHPYSPTNANAFIYYFLLLHNSTNLIKLVYWNMLYSYNKNLLSAMILCIWFLVCPEVTKWMNLLYSSGYWVYQPQQLPYQHSSPEWKGPNVSPLPWENRNSRDSQDIYLSAGKPVIKCHTVPWSNAMSLLWHYSQIWSPYAENCIKRKWACR